MLKNRSVPVDTVLPHITYDNLAAAIAWLNQAFGFVEHYRYGPPDAPEGAQLSLGHAWIMVNRPRESRVSPAQVGRRYTQSVTVFVDDLDAHFARAKSAGAEIVEELHETMYGERQYGAIDPEGHHWLFAQHARDVSPEEWGAIIARR